MQPFSRFSEKLTHGHLPTLAVTYLALLGFYFLTATSNYAETDDVFAFAYRAENFPLDYISDPRLMLYHMLMRGLYLGVSSVFPSASALFIMRAVALFSAPLILLLLAQLLTRHFSLRSSTAVLTAAFMAFSYGFWRYAVEADVYIPATLLIMLTLHLIITAGPGAGDHKLVGAAMLAALTVMFYQPAVLAVFLAFPLLLVTRERKYQLVIYLVVGGALTAIGYTAAYLYSQNAPLSTDSMLRFLSQRSQEFMVPPLSVAVFIKSVIKSGFALSHDLVSANWLFGIDGLNQLVQRVFPNNVIEEEIFAAKKAGWVPYLSLLWLTALAIILLKLIIGLRDVPWMRIRERRVQMVLLWLTINAAIIGRLNPAGIEAWLMVLVPLFILIAVFLLEPLVNQNRMPLLVPALALYLGHNITGGMAMMWNPAGDFDQVKASWAIERADENDLIIVVDDAGLAELLRYQSPAKVDLVRATATPRIAQSFLSGVAPYPPVLTYGRDFFGQEVFRHIQDTLSRKGAVFVFDEFFTWDTEYRNFYGPQTDYERASLLQLRENAINERHESAAGVTYQLSRPGAFAADAAR